MNQPNRFASRPAMDMISFMSESVSAQDKRTSRSPRLLTVAIALALGLGAYVPTGIAATVTGIDGGAGGTPTAGTGSTPGTNDGGAGGPATGGAGFDGQGVNGGSGGNNTTISVGGGGSTGGGDGGSFGYLGGGGGGGGNLESDGLGGGGGGGYSGGSMAGGGGGGGGGLAATFSSSATVASGDSYIGGSGGSGATGDIYGGGGGGGAGILVSAGILTNYGSITGGVGGDGPIAGLGSGSGGGGGGGALLKSGAALVNFGTIQGGNGGTAYIGAYGNAMGYGGAGIGAGGNTTITNKGTIAGGLAGNGTTRADAVQFIGGGNTLIVESGAIFTGNVVSTSGTTNGGDTLELGGGTDATLTGTMSSTAPTSYSGTPVFSGFTTLRKSGTSTWTISGVTGGASNVMRHWDIQSGVLKVTGDYNALSTDTLTIGVQPTTGTTTVAGQNYGQLSVTGTANLGSEGLNVDVASGAYTVGAQYNIVHAGTLTGTFGSVNYNPLFASYITPQVSYTGTDVYLTLTGNTAAFSTGQGVNIAGWATHLGLLGMQQGLLNVQGGTAGGILRVNHQPDPGVWVRYLGGSGSSDGARLNNQGLLLGYGSEVRDGLVLGAAFTRTEDHTKTDTQRVKTRATGLAVYGLFNHGSWFVDGTVSGGRLSTDSDRNLNPTGLVASGNANGNYAGFLAKAGYRITHGKLFLTPYALAGYQYTHRDAFTETGAGLLNLTYAGRTSNLSIFSAGTRIGTDWHIQNNLTLSPWIDLGAITYGGDKDQQQVVTLGTSSQVLQASGAPSVAGVVNAGVALMSNANWSAQLAYRGQFGSHTHMNSADLKVVYRW